MISPQSFPNSAKFLCTTRCAANLYLIRYPIWTANPLRESDPIKIRSRTSTRDDRLFFRQGNVVQISSSSHQRWLQMCRHFEGGGDGRKHNLIHLFDERRQFRQLRTTQSVREWLLTPKTQPAVWCSAKQTFSENHLAAAAGSVLVVHVCARMCVCEFARWKTSGKWAPRKALPAANDFKAFYV